MKEESQQKVETKSEQKVGERAKIGIRSRVRHKIWPLQIEKAKFSSSFEW
jgi:hypothetical protein